MTDRFYRSLIDPIEPILAEQSKEYLSITERHIQIVWLEQRFCSQLQTEEGDTIEVISPGVWNFCAGPDFLHAHLRINQQEFRGDIEIHLAEESWWKHGHGYDSRYSDVILHLFLWPMKEYSSQLSRFQALFRVGLLPYLLEPPEKLTHSIDLELYPFHLRNEPGRCSKELFSTLPKEEVLHLFQEAAYWRLKVKREALLAQTGDYNHAALLGCVEALGYPKNAAAFRKLLATLFEDKEQSEERLLSRALIATGYFKEPYLTKWGHHPFYRRLYSLANSPSLLPHIHLESGPIRPYSHPIRRVALMIKWLKESRVYEALFHQVERIWKEYWPTLEKPRRVKQLWKELKNLFIHPDDEHWSFHYTFEENPSKKPLSLMGDELFQRILINTFIPLLEGKILEREDPIELEQLYAFYHTQQTIVSGKHTYLQSRFFNYTTDQSLVKYADVEQGALQIHRDFCIHYETSCEGCPFVSRYRERTKPDFTPYANLDK